MRVLRLGLGDGRMLDLHPATSVLVGLSDTDRAALRRALRAIGSGLDPGVPGLLECHGVLVDATQADLDLLDVPLAPAAAVVAAAEVPGAVADGAALERLARAERDLLLLAVDRGRACDALARAEAAAGSPTPARLRARAAALRARLQRHAAVADEPVRAALDRVRDRRRAGSPPGVDEVVGALGPVGLDVADLGLPDDEVVRLAEDWLDERRLEAAALVGVEVELRGIETALARAGRDGASEPPGAADLDALRARAGRATAAHAEAIERAEAAATALARDRPAPPAAALERHLLDRLVAHRPARLAGSAPLLVDGAFEHLDDVQASDLLDRVAAVAGSVQLLVLDANPAVARWAQDAGIRRAAVVEATPAAPAPVPR